MFVFKEMHTTIGKKKYMELAHVDVYFFLADKTQNIFSLITEHSGFIKRSLNRLD